MRIDILTIFPSMFEPVLSASILKRAQEFKKVKIYIHDIRDYTKDKHRKVDDRPFGGGCGMVMTPEPIFSCVEAVLKKAKIPKSKRSIILLSAKGTKVRQDNFKKFSKKKHLVLICGHYEGVDERVAQYLVDEEISIGDYILTGGELAAMVLVDATVRLLPGVLGNEVSAQSESFEGGLLEYPQYTRPAVFRGKKVPDILLSGDHARIEAWRKKQAKQLTANIRPDLLVSK
ncbi:MAG: tRNA (guanosine(37)-N1)-methyltransferase TrmD [Candidatus Omnitrophota bacterium]